ncbi:MAG TPA: carbonic anhydrase [Acetobacteraceae bacterium]|nr:carbonic anhydrase [Acetobacteraceae bacterium]
MCERCAGLPRRGLLAAAATMLMAATSAEFPAAITGEDALHRLMEGNARYRANKAHARDFSAGRAARVATHRPIAAVLSCSDARVGPEFLFDQGPGDLFVVRVAGNVLLDEGLASIEYAAQFLGAPLVFVLGHSGCGAVEAAIKVVKDNATLPGHLPGLIDQLKPAVSAAQSAQPANLLNAAIAENVRRTMQAVTNAQPVIAPMVAGGKVTVAGGVYDIATGAVNQIH